MKKNQIVGYKNQRWSKAEDAIIIYCITSNPMNIQESFVVAKTKILEATGNVRTLEAINNRWYSVLKKKEITAVSAMSSKGGLPNVKNIKREFDKDGNPVDEAFLTFMKSMPKKIIVKMIADRFTKEQKINTMKTLLSFYSNC